jgi:hypothetical protein
MQRQQGRISPGNPASSTRAEQGPLYLRLGESGSGSEVAEELSLWDAICGAPRVLRVLARPQFDEFCSLVIKAVETANAPYGALVTLGLSPVDWSDELSVNTAKKISAFMTDVRGAASAGSFSTEGVEVWEQVWAKRQVPGFASARVFWSSSLGRALRLGRPVADASFAGLDDDDEPAEEARFDAAAVPDMLKRYMREGVLDWYDAWLLGQLAEGKTLQQVASSPRTRLKFGRARLPERYIETLRERVRNHRLS